MSAKQALFKVVSKMAMGACALVLAGGLTGCALTTPSLSEVEHEAVEPQLSAPDLVEDGYLTVAMNQSDAPQVLTDKKGNPSGYYGDLAHAIAQQLGLKLKVVPGTSADTVSKGEADLYFGAKASDASNDISVTGSVVEDGAAIFAKTADGSREIPTVSADALAGATVAVQHDSASQDALTRNGIKAEQKTFDNVNECFDALAADEVKYVACDATAGSYLSRAYTGVVFVGTISSVSSYGIAMPNSNSAVASAVAGVYEDFLDDGTIDAVHKAWYGGMPLSLSDTLLQGVTLKAEAATSKDGEEGEDGAEGDEAAEGEDTELSVSEGINSLG